MEDQQKKIIGSGLSFPLSVNLQANLQLSSELQNIDESIKIILGTKLGERKYRPTFGSRLDELVFAPMNTETLLLIRLYVTEALEKWEPRIDLLGVFVEVVSPSDQGRLNVMIQYRPKGYSQTRNLVYPFYLQS